MSFQSGPRDLLLLYKHHHGSGAHLTLHPMMMMMSERESTDFTAQVRLHACTRPSDQQLHTAQNKANISPSPTLILVSHLLIVLKVKVQSTEKVFRERERERDKKLIELN